jgi:riboflavin kinase/FMN adenylyltransferase
VWIATSLDKIQTPTHVALGNFDGVHRGHLQVIDPIFQGRRSPLHWSVSHWDEQSYCNGLDWSPQTVAALNQAILQGTASLQPMPPLAPSSGFTTVVTFDPHPRAFFSGQHHPLLTPLDEKVHVLRHLEVDQLVLLPFDQALAELTPQHFVEQILVHHLQAQLISVGQDFCFGRHRSGNSQDLQAIASQYGIQVNIVPLAKEQGERISSSAIRHALQAGQIDRANHWLGRPYTLVGRVIEGQQLGRTIGFPTANLALPTDKFVPCNGVYSVWVYGTHLASAEHPQPAVMNIGYRPTVNGTQQAIEIHVLDWTGDLYGQTLVVSLAQFLRPEQKFASLDELKTQIQQDCDQARSHLLAGLR